MKISYEDYFSIPYGQRNGIYEVENIGTFYYVNGNLHREDGPAEEYIDGAKYWYINDKYHRLDGPAIELASGKKSYYIEGKRYSSKEEFEKIAYMYKNGLQDYL